GVAPFRAFSSNPTVLPVPQTVTGNTVPLLAGAVPANTAVILTVQDSVGQTATVNVTVHPQPTTPPPALSVLPPRRDSLSGWPPSADVFSGTASTLTIVGGVAPYSAFSSNTAVLPVAQVVTGNAVTLLASPVTLDTKVNVTIQDAIGQTVVVVVTVHPQTT